MPLSNFPTATVSPSSDRTYPAGDSSQESSHRPQTDDEETDQRLPQRSTRSTPDVISQSSARANPPVTSNPSVSPRERLTEVEERIERLETELARLKSGREVVVDCQRGPTAGMRSNPNPSNRKRGRSVGRSARGRERKTLRNRNDDKNLLPKKDRFEWLLPKRNDNLLRKLFWP
ncbi:hypothetical protein [Haloprofundus salilacus]|uniref:hypothetical protein n=1 Tax=Haloprofundus salilacus TaxID=2876190 RepID=UPI001CCEAD77|nr:hypothetical protein [Haloprofundus salilacus]